MLREGDISIRLALQDRRIAAVTVASTRAALPARLTCGREAAAVAQMIPLLFSVCARAQGAASAAALEAARRTEPDDVARDSLDRAVRTEIIIELFTRLLIDWPRALGLEPQVATIARLRQASAATREQACVSAAHDHVFGTDPEAWVAATTLPALSDWIDRGITPPARVLRIVERDALDLGRSSVSLMPAEAVKSLPDVVPSLDDGDFARSPTWHGQPVETGPLARRSQHPLVKAYMERYGNTVAARLVAQLVDLAHWLRPSDEIAVHTHQLAPGLGLGAAQTARGLLLHQAEVCDGRVQRYRIVAPTEWNFHSDGALSQGLLGRRVADRTAAWSDATLLAQALDPCVAFTVEVGDA